jgi:sigma-B regulation protein RsbU (phosphoserine phosphatase)
MALGVEEDATWLQATVQIQPGDVLILFTDGIPDAQNDRNEFFDEESLIEVVQGNLKLSAHELQSAILKAIQDFAGNSPQFDDITLMILARDL